MKSLRKHLQAARSEHLAVKYPGDLAAEILPSRRGIGPMVWWIAPLAAAAAVVAIVFWLQHRAEPVPAVPQNGAVAIVDPPGTQNPVEYLPEDSSFADSYLAVTDVPSLPADWWVDVDVTDSVVPSFEEISSPQMPSMPSFDFYASSEETT